MALTLRPATEQDWQAIRELAFTVDPDDRAANDEWLRNRQKFDTTRYVRKHYVAEDDAKKIVGYGAIEQGPGVLHYRIFLVVHPELKDEVGQRLFAQLTEDLRALKAAKVWAREFGHGNNLTRLNFLRGQGFAEVNRVKTRNAAGSEVEIVRVEKNFD